MALELLVEVELAIAFRVIPVPFLARLGISRFC